MTTHDALLADIIAKPHDDLPRLVYADWLEENGQEERAEFIRVQREIARLIALGAHEGESCNVTGPCSDCHRDGEVFRLRRREGELMVIPAVYGSVPAINGGYKWNRGFVCEVRCTLADWCGGECRECDAGRVWVLSEPCPACSGTGRTPGIGPAVVRSHPVERVVLTDREPEGANHPYWVSQDSERANRRHTIPPALFDRLTGYECGSPYAIYESPYAIYYPDREAAMTALSAALISWAKSQPLS